jgi:hypothetical protein
MTTFDRSNRHLGAWRGVALALSLFAAACAPGGDGVDSGVTQTAGDAELGPMLGGTGCALQSVAGNGMTTNGLTGNGLCQNGLAAAGLNLAGVSTSSFATWFNTDPALANMVMGYLYQCAGSLGTWITWKNPQTGLSYTWAGGLGLAPGWTGGAAATVKEQQVVTACLGALVNRYGVHVPVAIEGRTAAGTQLAILPTELTTFSVKEGCFFGNLFTGEGVFVGLDHSSWDSKTSSARGCALDHQSVGPSIDCPPLYYVDYCSKRCTLDKTKTFYESCTFNGRTYQPLTTRLMPAEIYKCGDGVCQFTESCGSGADWNNCKSDCGLCK